MNSNSPVPAADTLLNQLTDYVLDYTPVNPEAYGTARYCLIDSMGCALRSLDDADCRRVLGPLVDDITITGGIRIPGLAHELEPVQAAFNLGSMIRWLDFNDTWLAAEWGHPSDNLGGRRNSGRGAADGKAPAPGFATRRPHGNDQGL